MADEIVRAAPVRAADVIESEDPAAPAVGKWYTIKKGAGQPRWVGCVVKIGSNYVEVQGVSGYRRRVHFSDFYSTCDHVPDPDALIGGKIAHHQSQVKVLMEKVREITARLAITGGPSLGSGSETAALAVRTEQPMKQYKKDLVKAKEKTLPELFQKIKDETESLSTWMKAKLIPLEAQVESLDENIDLVKARIFSVELYAGLVEEVEQVRDGEPAAVGEKVHLMQRRCYMDEECLAQYETGGMEFKNIGDFDRWLSRRSNLDRVLPFQRCLVAFRVRRHEKRREWANLEEFLKMIESGKLDKLTFLYIRNGEQLFRLGTGIEFGEQLFPDMSQDQLSGKLYAKNYAGGEVDSLISEGRYQEMVKKENDEIAEAKKEHGDSWESHFWHHNSQQYTVFDRDNVYYDDILKHIQAEMARHNRLVLVLQGLLDRSPVLHPHPPWALWSPDGFKAALELVYDDSRSLSAGDKPDFEKYREDLNASLKSGSVTIGQDDVWELREGRRESARIANSYRGRRSDYQPERSRPYGNPGPGKVARVHTYHPKAKTCTYRWAKARQGYGKTGELPDRITVRTQALLNVDAYKPGDFKRFFDDPRTRADYLRWAPLLLEAEEYYAGNRKVREPKVTEAPIADAESRYRYQARKRRKALVGKAVRLKYNVTTGDGHKYVKGTLWRATHVEMGKFRIVGIKPDGTEDDTEEGGRTRYVHGMDISDFVLVPDVPPAPKEAPDPDDAPDEEDEEDEEKLDV